jgi:hypothetical protein
LRDLFENKEYGIICDNSLTFNHKDGEETRNQTPILELLSQKSKKPKLNKNTKKTK